jgi:hypothetical protein
MGSVEEPVGRGSVLRYGLALVGRRACVLDDLAALDLEPA